MKKSMNAVFSAIFLLFLFPYLIAIILNGPKAALFFHEPDPEILVPALTMQQIEKDCREATLEAQTVIARTNLYRNIREKRQVSMEEKTEKSFWKIRDLLFPGRDAKRYVDAATATRGRVLTWKNEIRQIPWHELSAGRTRDGTEVFKSEEYGYLVSVESPEDKESLQYLSKMTVWKKGMPRKISIKERDRAGYVLSVLADGVVLEGEAFCRWLGLASTYFTIEKEKDGYEFTCRGIGHGLGFSQRGADTLAETGKSWRELLKNYFPKMKIKNIKSV